jgi:hypothetical protein
MSKESCPMCGDDIWIRHRRKKPLERCEYCTEEQVMFEMMLQVNPIYADHMGPEDIKQEICKEMAKAFVHVGRVHGITGK